jgi:GNAT superfamily N-acetyltransferase
VDTSSRSPAGAAPPVVVRVAADQELEAAGQAVRAAYAADGHEYGPYAAVLADARERARDATVVVAVDSAGQVVGSVTFALPGSRWAEVSGDGEAEFRMLGVVPAARGLGVGAALVDWCIDQARTLGRHHLVICTTTSMPAAQNLYTRRGFTRRPERDWSPVPDVHLRCLSLDLTSPPAP